MSIESNLAAADKAAMSRLEESFNDIKLGTEKQSLAISGLESKHN